MYNYFKKSFARKRARRYFKEYPIEIDINDFPNDGKIEFARWTNPLTPFTSICQGNVDFFRKFIKDGDFVIDIGANTGDTTVPMALASGKNGFTLAFDPNPHVFKVLERNAGLNIEKTNITPYPYSITETDSDFYYTSSEASYVNGGISKENTGEHGSYSLKEKVKGIVLADFLQENYSKWLSKLSFIKIDTEGYDKIILDNISDLIIKYKPIIVAECFEELPFNDRLELLTSVEEKGYELYCFNDFHIDEEIIKIVDKEETLKKRSNFNFYATPLN